MLELIDTCWDVNLTELLRKRANRQELIDTCWDVNQRKSLMLLLWRTELIDTCWDVNKFSMHVLRHTFARINRYMLGCKCVKATDSSMPLYSN